MPTARRRTRWPSGSTPSSRPAYRRSDSAWSPTVGSARPRAGRRPRSSVRSSRGAISSPAGRRSPPRPPSRRITLESHRIALLGGGFIGDFYTTTLHGQRSRDRVRIVYARDEARGRVFSERWDIPDSTTDMVAAIEHPDVDVVIVALPNHLHEGTAVPAATAGNDRS